jgi:hypothetical protein
MSGYSEGMPGPSRVIDKEAARILKPFDRQTLLEAVRAALEALPAASPGGP